VGFLDGLLGRRKPTAPKLDALFTLPGAAISLQVDLDFVPTGRGAVAFRAPEGRAFVDVADEVRALLDLDAGPPVTVTTDQYNFTWVSVTTDPPDIGSVVTDLHAVHSTLVDNGFGPQLLCSIVSFADPDGRMLALVYLIKSGSIYPFAPTGQGEVRDNVLELRVRDLLAREVPMERDLGRWFAVWGAPGL
jgi:hypothetical protein